MAVVERVERAFLERVERDAASGRERVALVHPPEVGTVVAAPVVGVVVPAVSLEAGVVVPVVSVEAPGAVEPARVVGVVVDGVLLPLSWGPRAHTMIAVNKRMATPVNTAMVTSRRSRFGRYVALDRRPGVIASESSRAGCTPHRRCTSGPP
jgi:hypothetical protein